MTHPHLQHLFFWVTIALWSQGDGSKKDPLPPTPAPRPLIIAGAEKPIVTPQYAKLMVTPEKGDSVTWEIEPFPLQMDDMGDGRIFVSGEVGKTYLVEAMIINFDTKKFQRTKVKLQFLKDNTPTPPDPGPGPGPGPGPTPGPAPIDGDGLQVLVVEETNNRNKTYTPVQLSMLFGKKFADYLNANCAADNTDSGHAWYIMDKDANAAGAGKKWKDALDRAKANPQFKVPWLIVSNPSKGGGYEGPLPAGETETYVILKKYGGN